MNAKNHLLLALLLLFLSACKQESKQPEAPEAAKLAAGTPEIQQLSKQIEANPDNAALYATRGVLWYDNQNFDEGIADLEKAIQLDSTKAEYFHELASMYMDYYKSRQGLNVMKRAAAAFPKRIPTLLKLAELQLILKQYADALFTLEQIRAISPLNAEMFFMFGNVFVDMGKKEEAIGAFQSAVENDPGLTDAWIKLADLLAEKNSPAAGKYYDNALRADSNNIDALHAKAYYLANKKNDLAGAIRLFKKTNVINPQYADGYYNVGLIYMDMDSLNQAYQRFDLAVKYAPEFAEAYYHRGLAAEKSGNIAQAKSDYDNVLRLDPDFQSAKEAIRRLSKEQKK
jgi:tetratricopeptide (TPR) repeat protein